MTAKRVCFKPLPNLRSIFLSAEDRPPLFDMAVVVYKIPCAKCSVSYIGQTRRKLSKQLLEHKREVSQADLVSSALVQHAWNNCHPVGWSDVQVFSVQHDDTCRIVQEVISIRTPQMFSSEMLVLYLWKMTAWCSRPLLDTLFYCLNFTSRTVLLHILTHPLAIFISTNIR